MDTQKGALVLVGALLIALIAYMIVTTNEDLNDINAEISNNGSVTQPVNTENDTVNEETDEEMVDEEGDGEQMTNDESSSTTVETKVEAEIE